MKKSVVEITPHPLNEKIYSLSNLDDLVRSISQKGLLQPIVINQHNQIISGHRRFVACSELGWSHIDCELVHTTGVDEETELIVHHNKQRTKTLKEQINEGDILRPLLSVGQGKRTDKTTSVLPNRSSGKRLSARDKVAIAIGMSPSQYAKALFIRKEDPELIDLIDGGYGTIHQVYTRLDGRKKDNKALEKRKTKTKSTNDFTLFIKSSKHIPELEDQSVQLIFTSPPYWNRRTFAEGSLGSEGSSDEFVENLVEHLQDCHRVLKDRGSFFLNLGDTRDRQGVLQNIPHKVSIGLGNQGWLLRNTIVWHKLNRKPSSSKSSLTNAYEFIFHFVKQKDYQYYPTRTDAKEQTGKQIRLVYHRDTNHTISRSYTPFVTQPENGANLTDFWDTNIVSTAVARNIPSENGQVHPATFPEKIVILPLIQTTNEGDLVLDPFSGSHTTGRVANRFGRKYVGYDIHHY